MNVNLDLILLLARPGIWLLSLMILYAPAFRNNWAWGTATSATTDPDAVLLTYWKRTQYTLTPSSSLP